MKKYVFMALCLFVCLPVSVFSHPDTDDTEVSQIDLKDIKKRNLTLYNKEYNIRVDSVRSNKYSGIDLRGEKCRGYPSESEGPLVTITETNQLIVHTTYCVREHDREIETSDFKTLSIKIDLSGQENNFSSSEKLKPFYTKTTLIFDGDESKAIGNIFNNYSGDKTKPIGELIWKVEQRREWPGSSRRRTVNECGVADCI